MPAYNLSDPRHPVSRARLLHAAALQLVQDGTISRGEVIPRSHWKRMVQVATGVLTDKAADDYTGLMDALGFVRRHHGQGVEVIMPGEAV